MTTDKRDELVRVTDISRDELVRQVAEKYDVRLIDADWQRTKRPILQAALSEMYSLARAETAKEIIEAAATKAEMYSASDTHKDGPARRQRMVVRLIAQEIRALASRYAETPATSCAAEAPTGPGPTKENK